MPVLTDKIAYFHVHKTGGTWAREAMRAGGLRCVIPMTDEADASTHVTPKNCKPQWLKDRFRITFVRDPFDWLRSWFCSRQKENWSKLQGPSQVLAQCHAPTFKTFLTSYLNEMPGKVGEIMGEYADPCHFVGRMENQPRALCEALVEGGESPDDWDAIKNFPLTNPALPHIRRKALCPLKLRQAVYEAESEYCAVYGYAPSLVEVGQT